MDNFYKNKLRLTPLLIVLLLLSLTSVGSNCNKILVNNGGSTDLVGTWKMIEQTGSLQDICPDETINFQSNGTAQLTCPGSSTITRNFTLANSVLTYTESSVSYDVEFSENNTIVSLFGRNVSRNLKYQKSITVALIPGSNGNTDHMNSSEAGK